MVPEPATASFKVPDLLPEIVGGALALWTENEPVWGVLQPLTVAKFPVIVFPFTVPLAVVAHSPEIGMFGVSVALNVDPFIEPIKVPEFANPPNSFPQPPVN